MDQPSRGTSDSESKSSTKFGNMLSFDLTNVVRRPFSSVARPKIYSEPLEHQLAPAIQLEKYRHAPLDRMANDLGQILGTNDQTHPFTSSQPSASSPLASNLNQNIVLRHNEYPLHTSDGEVAHLADELEDEYRAYQQWRTGMIVAIVLFAVFTVLTILFFVWRHQRFRQQQRMDVEALTVNDETIPAPYDDTHIGRPAQAHTREGCLSLRSKTSRQLSSLTLENPFADPQRNAVEESGNSDVPATANNAEQTRRSSVRRNPSLDPLASENPFIDPHAGPQAEQELSEKIDDGLGGYWRAPGDAPSTKPSTQVATNDMCITKDGVVPKHSSSSWSDEGSGSGSGSGWGSGSGISGRNEKLYERPKKRVEREGRRVEQEAVGLEAIRDEERAMDMYEAEFGTVAGRRYVSDD